MWCDALLWPRTPVGKAASERHCVQDASKWSMRKTLTRLSGFGAGNKDLAELRALRIGAAELDFLDPSPQKKSPSPFTQAFEVPHPLSTRHQQQGCSTKLLGSSMSAHPQTQLKAHAAVAWRLVPGGSFGRQAVPVPGAGLALVQQCSAPDTLRCSIAPWLCTGKVLCMQQAADLCHACIGSQACINDQTLSAANSLCRRSATIDLAAIAPIKYSSDHRPC